MLHVIPPSFQKLKYALLLHFGYPHWFCINKIGRDGFRAFCALTAESCGSWCSHLHSSINGRKMHLRKCRLEPCEMNKVWGLIPHSLKLMSKFLLSQMAQDGSERNFGTEGWCQGLREVNRKSQSWKEKRNGKKKKLRKNKMLFALQYFTEWSLEATNLLDQAEKERMERMSKHISFSRSVDVQLLQLSSSRGMC